jgi:hypothetical protein
VNEQIRAQRPGRDRVMNYDAAVEAGAMALFGEKYGDEVRVLKIGGLLDRTLRRHARAARRRHRPVQDRLRRRRGRRRASHRGVTGEGALAAAALYGRLHRFLLLCPRGYSVE